MMSSHRAYVYILIGVHICLRTHMYQNFDRLIHDHCNSKDSLLIYLLHLLFENICVVSEGAAGGRFAYKLTD